MKTIKKKVCQLSMEGDIYTAIGIFQSLPGEKKILLESSLKHEQQGRYSFIASNPYMEISSRGDTILQRKEDGTVTEQKGRFLDVIKELLPEEEELSEAPFPFLGGAVGYVGYDIIRQYEDIGPALEDELDMPEAHLMFYKDIVVYDHFKQQVSIVSIENEDEEEDFLKRAQRIKKAIQQRKPNAILHTNEKKNIDFQATISQQQFEEMVQIAKKNISEGDIFQVVLSQRYSTHFTGDPFQFYRALRKHNPSPYMFYVDFQDYQVLGSSPESLLKGNGTTVTTNPIAGTRRRGRTVEEDKELQVELLQDEKELAEHRMLVDLGRNDLGRVCEIGTIELSKYMLIEKYKHVMHIVSEVIGKKRADMANMDVLASCLPAGTVSGAPKIRAMNIINDLEQVKRNVYGGAVGYFSSHGSFDFALAIRTMLVKDEKAIIQAGAGIVYDSEPQKEYQEVLNKAKALMEVEI